MRDAIPSVEAISRSYDERFAEGGLRESESFYRWVLKRLNPTHGKNILDISCGEGHLLRWASRLHDLETYGIDLSTVALNLCRENVGAVDLNRCDGSLLPFPDHSFDYITNLGSLEHYAHIARGVREMARVLRPEGKAAVLLPNSYYVADIVWRVWRTGYGPSHQQPLERFATVGEWHDILSEGGIDIQRTYAYNFLFPVRQDDWAWYGQRPRRFLNLMIAPLVPFNLSYCHLFIGKRRPNTR
jgi:SAM-dependent methyltransferase